MNCANENWNSILEYIVRYSEGVPMQRDDRRIQKTGCFATLSMTACSESLFRNHF